MQHIPPNFKQHLPHITYSFQLSIYFLGKEKFFCNVSRFFISEL
jgi:hypothetical protein